MATQPDIFLPSQRDPLFAGRESILQNLSEMLCDHQRVVLHGAAGQGKTACALEYAYRFSHNYRWIFWLNAASSATLLADLSALCLQLAIPVAPAEQNLASMNQKLQDWLANHQGYLFILDNVAGINQVSLPEQSNGHTLLLTRAPTSDPLLAHLALDKLSEQDGALLILRQTGQISASDALEQTDEQLRACATTLARELNGLPLAIKLGSAYIQATNNTIQEYITTYREYAERLRQLHASKDSDTDAIAITCSLPAIRLQQTQPIAAELLWICTVLTPEAIPQMLFSEGTTELGPALQEVAQNSTSSLDEALAHLSSFGLVTAQAAPTMLNMSPTVQETLFGAQSLDKRRKLGELVLRAFSHLLPSLEHATPGERMRQAVHILHLAICSSEWTIAYEPVAAVFCWAASLFWEYELIQEAEITLRKALTIWERTLDLTHPTLGITRQNLAILNASLQRYTEAEALLHSAILARSQVSGATHPDVILSLINLADIYVEQDKTPEALACYQEALKLGEPALGKEHTLLVTAAYKLATLYTKQENFEQAEKYYQQVLSFGEKTSDAGDKRMQECLEQMAMISLQQNKFAEAEERFQQLLSIKESSLGNEHPDIIDFLQKIVLAELVQEKWEQAEETYKRLLALSMHMYGEEHAETLQYQEQLAVVSLQQGHFEQAEALLQHVLEIREKNLGPQHPDVAASLAKLANIYLAQKRAEAAATLLQRALTICLRQAPPDLFVVSSILANLATAMEEQGLHEQALALSRSAHTLHDQITES